MNFPPCLCTPVDVNCYKPKVILSRTRCPASIPQPPARGPVAPRERLGTGFLLLKHRLTSKRILRLLINRAGSDERGPCELSFRRRADWEEWRSEEHTSELQSLM